MPLSSGFESNLIDAMDYLDHHELERYARFKSIHARDTFLQTRKIIKEVLAQKLDCQANEIQFCYSETGKPSLKGFQDTPWKFSLSHSHNNIAVAIAHFNIGVDIEDCDRCLDILDKTEDFLNAHAAKLVQNSEDEMQACDMFARYWSCMESYVKLKGSAIWHEKDRVILQDTHLNNNPQRFNFEDSYFTSYALENCRLSLASKHSNVLVNLNTWPKKTPA